MIHGTLNQNSVNSGFRVKSNDSVDVDLAGKILYMEDAI